jgi:hypothetical protein
MLTRTEASLVAGEPKPEDTEQADRRAHPSHEIVSTQDAESAIGSPTPNCLITFRYKNKVAAALGN